MNRYNLIPIAVIVAAAAVAIARRAEPPAAPPTAATASVILTTRELPVGAVVTAADLMVVEWPAAALPPRGYASFPEQVIGLTVTEPMYEHDLLRPQRLRGQRLDSPLR